MNPRDVSWIIQVHSGVHSTSRLVKDAMLGLWIAFECIARQTVAWEVEATLSCTRMMSFFVQVHTRVCGIA